MDAFPFKVKVTKTGNSLKVTIPSRICNHLNIKRGDSVEITVVSKTALQLQLIKKNQHARAGK